MAKDVAFGSKSRDIWPNLLLLVVVTVWLGILIGVGTNLISNVLQQWHPRLSLSVCLSLLALSTLVVVYKIYLQGHETEATIEIVLPFEIKHESVSIIQAGPYRIAGKAGQAFQVITKDAEQRRAFLDDWRTLKKDDRENSQGFANECLQDLVQYIVLFTIKQYGEMTLTPAVVYGENAWQMKGLKSRDVDASDWPSNLRNSLIFKPKSNSVFNKLRLPETVTLASAESSSRFKCSRPDIVLKSKFGSIVCSVVPYQEKVSPASRDGEIMQRYCGRSNADGLWIGRFRLRVMAVFGGWRVLSNEFRDSVVPWSEGLLRHLESSLDWRQCVNSDLERMVIELGEQVRALRKAAIPSGSVPLMTTPIIGASSDEQY